MVGAGMAAGGQGARLRAAVERLHAAQVAALAAPGAPVVPAGQGGPGGPGGPGGLGGSGGPGGLEAEAHPAGGRDAYEAERQLLAQVAEMGSLLVRLGLLAPADVAAVEVRRRLVALAVACGNTLAELVTLAFEVTGATDGPDAGAGKPH
jgi:hypothetical protein